MLHKSSIKWSCLWYFLTQKQRDTCLLHHINMLKMIGIRFILLLALCSVSPSHGYIKDGIEDLVNRLWSYIAEDRLLVTSPHIDVFLARYDTSSKDVLDLEECEFKTGEKSWVKDFQNLGVTVEYAAAYFKTLDVRGNGFVSRLSIEDLDELVDICEKHANSLSSRGYLYEDQFKKGFREVVFRSLPYTLLFIRASRTLGSSFSDNCRTQDSTLRFIPKRSRSLLTDLALGNINDDGSEGNAFQYELLSRRTWNKLFFIIANSENNPIALEIEITEESLQNYWESGKYGTQEEASQLFKAIVEESSSAIQYATWRDLFRELDCRNQDDYLDIMEFLQLDLLAHGKKTRNDGRCLLKRNWYIIKGPFAMEMLNHRV